ncbi:ABC transporter ATP-binding protein [Arthrobacter alpinus]|nr:ABC transporter ATP-binding protein [Arthrobacter alpinus]
MGGHHCPCQSGRRHPLPCSRPPARLAAPRPASPSRRDHPGADHRRRGSTACPGTGIPHERRTRGGGTDQDLQRQERARRRRPHRGGGEIFGFLGPNGAGKTTTLRLVTGMARPTSGTITVLGQELSTAGNAVRAQLGFLPDVPAFYPWMTAMEFMHLAGDLSGLDHRVTKSRTAMLLDSAGLGGVMGRIGGYSRGMRQRLGIAQALINAPAAAAAR